VQTNVLDGEYCQATIRFVFSNMLSELNSRIVLVYEAPGVTVHFTLNTSHAIGELLHVESFVTTHVGRVEVEHDPPIRLMFSVIVAVFQPPVVIAKSSKISG